MAESFKILHGEDLELLTGCKTPVAIGKVLQSCGIPYKRRDPIIWTTSTKLDDYLGGNQRSERFDWDAIKKDLAERALEVKRRRAKRA